MSHPLSACVCVRACVRACVYSCVCLTAVTADIAKWTFAFVSVIKWGYNGDLSLLVITCHSLVIITPNRSTVFAIRFLESRMVLESVCMFPLNLGRPPVSVILPRLQKLLETAAKISVLLRAESPVPAGITCLHKQRALKYISQRIISRQTPRTTAEVLRLETERRLSEAPSSMSGSVSTERRPIAITYLEREAIIYRKKNTHIRPPSRVYIDRWSDGGDTTVSSDNKCRVTLAR